MLAHVTGVETTCNLWQPAWEPSIVYRTSHFTFVSWK